MLIAMKCAAKGTREHRDRKKRPGVDFFAKDISACTN